MGIGSLAAVTGCASSTGGTRSAAPVSTPEKSSSAPAPTPTDPFGAFPTGDGGDGGGSGLVAAKDVPVGGGVVVQGTLVVQPRKGVFKAFSATCPHQGVTVNPPVNGIVECPGHNSEFKASDGSLVRGPATRGLTAIAVKVSGGYVTQA